MKYRESTSLKSGRAGMLGLAVAAALAISVPTLAADAAKVEAGRQVWMKGGCAACHGTLGGGGANPDFPVGPSLRATELDRNALVEIISCGRPGKPMPAWLKGAYTETGCFGQDPGRAPAGTVVVGAFDADQIEALVEYIMVEFNGK